MSLIRTALSFPQAASAALLLVAATPLVAHAQEAAPANTAPASALKAYDLKAEALLQRAADRMQAAQSLSGRYETTSSSPAEGKTPARKTRTVRILKLQKPNRVYNEVTTEQQGPDGKWTVASITKYVSDGSKGVGLSTTDKTYRVLHITKEELAMSYDVRPFDFFDPAQSALQFVRDEKASGILVSLTVAPDAVWSGVPCFAVEKKSLYSKQRNLPPTLVTQKIYVGKSDGVIRGGDLEWPQPGGGAEAERNTFTNIVVGSHIPAATFAFNLTGYKESVAPPPPPLLAAGTLAPEFTVADKDGKPVKLSDYRGKIVVMDFWATWCVPCMKALPDTADVAKKNADKGVVVLAVNVWDTKDAFDKWLPVHPEYAPLTFVIDTTTEQGQDVASKLYKVWGIPTQYVIDRDGKIVASFVMGSAENLEKAIAKADAKAGAAGAGAAGSKR